MNYDELATGTRFKRKDGSQADTVLIFADKIDNKIFVGIENNGKWLGTQSFYVNYFEDKYEQVEVEDEQD